MDALKTTATKSLYKYELARAAGVSTTTFRKWCNDNCEQLTKLGCRRHAHILTPAAVKFLCERYCITIE